MNILDNNSRIIVNGIISGLEKGREYNVELTNNGLYKLRKITSGRRVSNKCIRFGIHDIDSLIGTSITKKEKYANKSKVD